MLDNAEAESNERAARRAERARARKTEEDTSNHTGPVITDKLLAELDDEETLQTFVSVVCFQKKMHVIHKATISII